MRQLKKISNWSHSKRALSPIFATVLLASMIIVFGSVAYYYSTNITTNATNSYVNSMSGSQQSIAERIGFENVAYNSSSPAKLTVYIINSGSTNNLQINSLKPIDSGVPTPNSGLNVGQEAYFTITLGKDASGNNISLTSGSIYTINLITKNGSDFNYEFSP